MVQFIRQASEKFGIFVNESFHIPVCLRREWPSAYHYGNGPQAPTSLAHDYQIVSLPPALNSLFCVRAQEKETAEKYHKITRKAVQEKKENHRLSLNVEALELKLEGVEFTNSVYGRDTTR